MDPVIVLVFVIFLLPSAPGTAIKTGGALNRILTSSESVSNLSDPDSAKKNRRELRLGDRVLVRVTESTVTAGVRAEYQRCRHGDSQKSLLLHYSVLFFLGLLVEMFQVR